MSLVGDIARTYRAPARVVGEKMAGATEASVLKLMWTGCLLVFIAYAPVAARAAHLDPAMSLTDRLIGAFVAWLIFAPLPLYGLAALGGLAARAFGGRGPWLGARLALVWALVAAGPLWLLWGLMAGFTGPESPAAAAAALLALTALAIFWIAGLRNTQWPPSARQEKAHV